MEAALGRFQAAHTQVVGVSVDSIYCHAAWGASLGGISFPLLADFHPKGAVASAFGVYLEKAGIADRATIIVDSGGTVRYAGSVTPSGKRDIEELVAECERVDSEAGTKTVEFARPAGLEPDAVLYVRNNCGASRAVLLARENLHLGDRLPVRNVSEDAGAASELERLTGGGQAPCLVSSGKPLLESAAIIAHLVEAAAPPLP